MIFLSLGMCMVVASMIKLHEENKKLKAIIESLSKRISDVEKNQKLQHPELNNLNKEL